MTRVLPQEKALEILKAFQSHDLLISNYENHFQGTPLEKHIDFFTEFSSTPNKLQENIRKKKVLIIGVGGIGSVILLHLLALGIKNYILVDYDIVQPSNLNRQFLFDLKDAGQSKVHVAKKKLLEKNPSAQITVYEMQIATHDQLLSKTQDQGIDFIFCCADTPPHKIRLEILTLAIKLNVPCTFGGVNFMDGTYGPLLADNDSKIQYYKRIEKALEHCLKDTMKPLNLSIGFTNTLISTLMVMDVSLYLLGQKPKSLNSLIHVDFNNLEFSTYKVSHFSSNSNQI